MNTATMNHRMMMKNVMLFFVSHWPSNERLTTSFFSKPLLVRHDAHVFIPTASVLSCIELNSQQQQQQENRILLHCEKEKHT